MVIKHENLNFDTDKLFFVEGGDDVLVAKYLKGIYRGNKSRFIKRFVNHFNKYLTAYEFPEMLYIIKNIEDIWDSVKPFSYEEAFKIDNNSFRALVFSSIDIREMVKNLGAERIAVEGKELINKTWNTITKEFEMIPYTVVYELYHVSGKKIGINDSVKLPIIKCWCTSTNEEHWLWADNNSFEGDSPLNAIASTCVIYKSMVGKIKHIIRQGDVFLFEMTEDVCPSETEETLTLPMNEYFNLLKSQS